MSYKIQYMPEKAYRYPAQKKRMKVKWGKCIVFLIAIFAVTWIQANGIPDFLIPGDPDITKAAAAGMVKQIRYGEPVSDAVTVFCKEILNGAGYKTIS